MREEKALNKGLGWEGLGSSDGGWSCAGNRARVRALWQALQFALFLSSCFSYKGEACSIACFQKDHSAQTISQRHGGDCGQLSKMPRGNSWEEAWKKRDTQTCQLFFTKGTAPEHCFATALPEYSLLTNVVSNLYEPINTCQICLQVLRNLEENEGSAHEEACLLEVQFIY